MPANLLTANAARHDSGFIMFDALLAVTIAALGLGIILTSTQISRKNSDVGHERREALVRLQLLLESTKRTPIEHEAVDATFKSSVKVTKTSEGRVSFCQVRAKLTSLRTKRTYELSGLRWCTSAFGVSQ